MSNSKWRFQTFKSGYLGNDKPEAEQQEALLPTGVQNNEESYAPDDPDVVETDEGPKMLPPLLNRPKNSSDRKTIAENRPVADDDEVLYPLGVNPKYEN